MWLTDVQHMPMKNLQHIQPSFLCKNTNSLLLDTYFSLLLFTEKEKAALRIHQAVKKYIRTILNDTLFLRQQLKNMAAMLNFQVISNSTYIYSVHKQ
jgi:predicted metal-dependent peptidase